MQCIVEDFDEVGRWYGDDDNTCKHVFFVTHSIVGAAIVTASVGVRQGFPTSCLLLIIFVNNLIALIKKWL